MATSRRAAVIIPLETVRSARRIASETEAACERAIARAKATQAMLDRALFGESRWHPSYSLVRGGK